MLLASGALATENALTPPAKEGRPASPRDCGYVFAWRHRDGSSAAWDRQRLVQSADDVQGSRTCDGPLTQKLDPSRTPWSEIRVTNSETVGSQSHSLRQRLCVRPG